MLEEYHDIIVGAGSSGAVLAARLSQDPRRRVLLLEAGPDYRTLEDTPDDLRNAKWMSMTGHDWGMRANAVRGRVIHYPRGKVIGGSSAVNACIALRGIPQDYDEWAAGGGPSWSWSNVLPYFRKLEDDRDHEGGVIHGQGGPLPICRWRSEELLPVQAGFRDAALALGFPGTNDHNDPASMGVGPWPMNRRGSLRFSTAMAYLQPARSRPNLVIRPGALVARVLCERGRAIGVELATGRGVETIRSGQVILSAGAIGSPAILLRSGIGPALELAALDIPIVCDLPGVGRNLIDHPQAGVSVVPKAGICDPSQPVAQIGLRYTAEGSTERADMQLYTVGQADLTQTPALMSLVGAPMIFSVMAVLQRPRSRGQVALASADPRLPPRIDLNYLQDPEDRRRLMDGVRLAWRLVKSGPLAAYGERIVILTEQLLERDMMLAGYLQMAVTTIYHPVGTNRMGGDADDRAVVDEDCRVRGVSGLRVIDASIMPTIPRANTNLTCIMIGERMADRLASQS